MLHVQTETPRLSNADQRGCGKKAHHWDLTVEKPKGVRDRLVTTRRRVGGQLELSNDRQSLGPPVQGYRTPCYLLGAVPVAEGQDQEAVPYRLRGHQSLGYGIVGELGARSATRRIQLDGQCGEDEE